MSKYNVLWVFYVVLIILFSSACGSSETGEVPNNGKTKADSLTALINLVESEPTAKNYFLRGQYHDDNQNYSDAINDFIQCTELDSSRTDCWHALSDAFLDDHRSREAVETLESYLKLFPSDISTLLKLSELQIIIERYQAAHFNLNAVLRQESNHDQALFLKGVIYRYEEKPIQAVEYLQQAIQSNPDLADGHLMLGQLFEEAGNPMAEKYYENALRIEPEYREAQLAYANYLWLTDKVLEAQQEFQTLTQKHPSFAKGHYNQGLLQLELDSVTNAVRSFEAAVDLEPRFILAHYYLGVAYELLGNIDLAFQSIEEAQKLSPSDQLIKQKYNELKLNRK